MLTSLRQRGSGAARLATLGIACLAALPAVMAIAHRSSPLLLSLAAMLGLAATLSETRAAPLGRRLFEALLSPVGVAILAFLAWAAASCAWSPSGPRAMFALGEFVLPLAAALLAAATLSDRIDARAVDWLAAGMIVATLIVVADLATGLALRRAIGLRAAPFVLNRPALTLLVLLPGALVLCGRDRSALLASAVAGAVALAIFRSESGAAKLGLVSLFVVGGLTLLSRRMGLLLIAVALLASLALAPVSGELAARLLPAPVYRALAAAHAQDRVDIWRSFGAALRERPVLGQGFGATARLQEAPVAARIDPDHAFLLGVGHPHSAALQIWVELGAVGAALAALVAGLLVRAMARLPPRDCAAAAGLVAAALADSLVGQGAWQGWWPAGIGAALVWFGSGRHVRPTDIEDGSHGTG